MYLTFFWNGKKLLQMLSILLSQAIKSSNNFDKVYAIFHLIQNHNESHSAPVSPLWAFEQSEELLGTQTLSSLGYSASSS